jgi:multiple sugar transport system permease protein
MTAFVGPRLKRRSILLYAVLALWCVVVVFFPIYWTVITSFKQPKDISQNVTYIPWVDFQPTLQAWDDILAGSDQSMVFQSFTNGAIASLGGAGIAVILGAMAGYALSRFQYRFGSWRNNEIAFWFISQRIMPPVAVVLAFLIMYRVLGILDNIFSLTLAYISFNLPLAIWILRDYFANVPKELEESALIDGASRLRAFWEIALPLAMPGVVAAFILCFIFTWNEYLFALILTFQNAGTVPLLLAAQVTGTGVQWWRMSVLTLMGIVPSIACAFALERYIVSGLFAGGLK